jgi:hypothetical protein
VSVFTDGMKPQSSEGVMLAVELIYARALWTLNQDAASAAISGATNALVEGHDSEPLRELAGAPVDLNVFELGALIESSLASLGASTVPMTEDDALVLIARSRALQVLDGRLPVRDFTAWAHSAIGHGGPAVAQDIVLLDDLYDEFERGWGGEPDPTRTLKQFLDASWGAVQKWAPPRSL